MPQPGIPERSCDVVMKGGITSGIVYPPLVGGLKDHYRFRNIGGTSAGAIAAAATAAAELGRQRGRGGFAELDKLPGELGARDSRGQGTRLAALFTPQPATRALFATLRAALPRTPDSRSRGRGVRVAMALLGSFPLAALLGGLPGVVVAGLILASSPWTGGSGWSGAPASRLIAGWGVGAGLLLAALGAAAAALAAFLRRATRELPRHGFGLCSGLGTGTTGAGSTASDASAEALTPWLAGLLDRLAGQEAGRPLTFGDLWGSRDPDAPRQVNLEMMTTNLTQGLPSRLPFLRRRGGRVVETRRFYFDPAELRRLFPEPVVAWMVERAPSSAAAQRYAPLVPLPAAADLPVVVATRMSLSFPLLLSAVPLWAIDYSRRMPRLERRPERCWFSDGGIASNFPVHFFDQPLPRWPTFGVNLRGFHEDFREGNREHAVFLPRRNGQGVLEWWTRFDRGPGAAQLAGFAGAIFNAMRNWRDNEQTRLPGYRDRVVHVSLEDRREGGLNLDMPPEVIAAVSARGRAAAAKLVEHFGDQPPAGVETTWRNHRWVRFRSSLGLIEDLLRRIDVAWREGEAGDSSYGDLLDQEGATPPSYPLTATQQARAAALGDGLAALAPTPGPGLAAGAPSPPPSLRIVPDV